MIFFNYAQHVVAYPARGSDMSLCTRDAAAGQIITPNGIPCSETHVHSASHEVVGRGEMPIVDEHFPADHLYHRKAPSTTSVEHRYVWLAIQDSKQRNGLQLCYLGML